MGLDVLYVLQNAWRRDAPQDGRLEWKPRYWKRALWRSQTGRRLREMIPPDVEFEVVNGSPFVGNSSASRFAADACLMRARLKNHEPRLVVLLGAVAGQLAQVLDACNQPYLCRPHPAWRQLSKQRTAQIREETSNALLQLHTSQSA